MDPQVDNEASKDPAADHKIKLPFDEKDFEGKTSKHIKVFQIY